MSKQQKNPSASANASADETNDDASLEDESTSTKQVPKPGTFAENEAQERAGTKKKVKLVSRRVMLKKKKRAAAPKAAGPAENRAKNFRKSFKLQPYPDTVKGREARRQFVIREKVHAEARSRREWRKAGRASLFISVGEGENSIVVDKPRRAVSLRLVEKVSIFSFVVWKKKLYVLQVNNNIHILF